MMCNTRSSSGKSCGCKLFEFNFSKIKCSKINDKKLRKKIKPTNRKCVECLTVIGLEHKQKEHLACDIIMEKLNNEASENKDSILLSKSRGKAMSVHLSQTKNDNAMLISADRIAQTLLIATGERKLFEINLKEKFQALNHSLDSHFDVTKCQLISTKAGKPSLSQPSACQPQPFGSPAAAVGSTDAAVRLVSRRRRLISSSRLARQPQTLAHQPQPFGSPAAAVRACWARVQPSQPNDLFQSDKLKELAQEHLPEGWTEWKVSQLSKEQLLGSSVDPLILNKIRFALPTVGVVKAFIPEADHLSEKTYRDIKVSMLE
ncbi:unnamed protein product [Brassicogethes aeneus]|uniref:Uncharacterized protein n=1 Tax=Brassicogethes aeneus TaxID=1431903 RepID=A0A9P0FLT8_BRAAE|nr:unnamed protein product [Brassicogethes aeneus]